MKSSTGKILANRRNAEKSTGPTSAAGKEKVSRNRTTHGLLGRFQVFEGEDQEQYNDFVDQLIVDEKPVGLAEVELVKTMAEHMWMSKRARRRQEACFHVERTPRTHRQRYSRNSRPCRPRPLPALSNAPRSRLSARFQ